LSLDFKDKGDQPIGSSWGRMSKQRKKQVKDPEMESRLECWRNIKTSSIAGMSSEGKQGRDTQGLWAMVKSWDLFCGGKASDT
jgi:hypothetical protein